MRVNTVAVVVVVVAAAAVVCRLFIYLFVWCVYVQSYILLLNGDCLGFIKFLLMNKTEISNFEQKSKKRKEKQAISKFDQIFVHVVMKFVRLIINFI